MLILYYRYIGILVHIDQPNTNILGLAQTYGNDGHSMQQGNTKNMPPECNSQNMSRKF